MIKQSYVGSISSIYSTQPNVDSLLFIISSSLQISAILSTPHQHLSKCFSAFYFLLLVFLLLNRPAFDRIKVLVLLWQSEISPAACIFQSFFSILIFHFSLNFDFSARRKYPTENVEVFIHGHSLNNEVAFYELYMTGAIDSKQDLENYIGTLVPGFKGLTQKEFDAIMSKWLFHLLAIQFWN